MENQNKKDEKEESEEGKKDSSKEKKPNKNIEPPKFYNLSEGVNPNKNSDEETMEKEKK